MHKRSSWIFVVFAVLIIAGVVSCLIFWPKNDHKTPDKPNDIIQDDDNEHDNNQGNDNDGDNDDNDGVDDQVFATSLVINLPNTINVFIGSYVKFLSGYLQVQPTEMLDDVTVTIVPKYHSIISGITFEDSRLTANQEGTYNIVFSVAKSSTENLTKAIEIVVHNDNSLCHVEQKKTAVIKAEPTNIYDLFTFKAANDNVLCDENTSFNDGFLTAYKTGDCDLTISFTENYVQYYYKFTLHSKEQPLYSIILTNVTNNTVEIDRSISSAAEIYYLIKNRNEERVEQFVIATITDETVAIVEKVAEPRIKVKALKAGSTTLKVVCGADKSVFIEIELIIK